MGVRRPWPQKETIWRSNGCKCPAVTIVNGKKGVRRHQSPGRWITAVSLRSRGAAHGRSLQDCNRSEGDSALTHVCFTQALGQVVKRLKYRRELLARSTLREQHFTHHLTQHNNAAHRAAGWNTMAPIRAIWLAKMPNSWTSRYERTQSQTRNSTSTSA